MKKIQNQNEKIIKEAKELFNRKQFEKSKEKLEKLLNPNITQKIHKDVIHAAILVRTGKADEALRLISEVELKLQQGAESEETINIKTVAYRAKNELINAVNLLQRGLKKYPNSIDLAHNLSVTAADLGNLGLAEEAALRALKINPNSIETYKNLGRIYVTKRDITKAKEIFNNLEKITSKSNVDVIVGKGAIELMQSNAINAAKYFEAALKTDDSLSAAWSNLGICYKYMGNYKKAKECLENAVKKDPSQIEHQWNLALVNLALGNYVDGWKQYEVRYNQKRITPDAVKLPTTKIPMLVPTDAVDGKTIILVQEQGYGDTFQFFRFAKNLKEEGAKKIIAIVSNEMAEVIRTIPWIDEVYPEIKQTSSQLDFWVFAMSLPLRYNLTSVEKIPSYEKYISIDQIKKSNFEKNLGQNLKKLRIGLVWAGRDTHSNDSNRSINFKLLEPILEMHSNVEFYSLQKGQREVDGIGDNRIKSYGGHLTNFADTAALLSNLDILISVDSAPAHLAGALGMPVWVLIPTIHDFRWLIDRTDSPWYPNMRLFRQGLREPWTDVITRIKLDLEKLLNVPSEPWQPDYIYLFSTLEYGKSHLAGISLYLNSAFQYHLQGDLIKAEYMYQKCLKYQPNLMDAIRNLAALYRSKGDLSRSEEIYKMGEIQRTFDPIFYTNYANLLIDMGRFGDALSKAELVLINNPNNEDAKRLKIQCQQMIWQTQNIN